MPRTKKINKKLDDKIILLALAEDLGKKDLTGSLIPKTLHQTGYIIAKQPAVICGISWANRIFYLVDHKIKIKWLVKDGEKIKKGQILCKISGPTRSILAAERTVLNFLQTLSGTATLTKKFTEFLPGAKPKLLDTRKTLPGLRTAQKYAVLCGGGTNHRFGLYDAILIKENHIAASGSITKAVALAHKLYPRKSIEVEVRNLIELQEALDTKANIIMLDNFSYAKIKAAVKLNAGSKKLEVSGGVSLNNLGKLAKTGVDYISVGIITKTVIPIDLSLIINK